MSSPRLGTDHLSVQGHYASVYTSGGVGGVSILLAASSSAASKDNKQKALEVERIEGQLLLLMERPLCNARPQNDNIDSV